MEILDERRDRPIEEWGPVLHRVEHMMVDSVVVPVPDSPTQRAIERDRYEIHPRLDQPAGEQASLPPSVPPIAIPNSRVFQTEVECAPRLRTGQYVQRLATEFIQPVSFREFV